jgi:predicted  nucleic acid-binding Zn-ribbon protein
MSDQSKAAGEMDPLVRPFLEVWSSFLVQTGESARKLLESYDRSGNVGQLSRERLDSAREKMDDYLRSPEFLNAMKQNIDVMIKTKRQLNDLYRELAPHAGGAASGEFQELSEGLRAAGESVRARLSEIEKQMATVDAKLIQITSSDFFESASFHNDS